jgi:hypothetical protein
VDVLTPGNLITLAVAAAGVVGSFAVTRHRLAAVEKGVERKADKENHDALAKESRETAAALRERQGKTEERIAATSENVVALRVETLGMKHAVEKIDAKLDRLLDVRGRS